MLEDPDYEHQLVLAVKFMVEAAMGFYVSAVKKWVILIVEVLVLMKGGWW